MKYAITYSCGHSGTVELFGKGCDRERKLKWYSETAVCPECYKAERLAEEESTELQVFADATVDIDYFSAEPLFNVHLKGSTMLIKDKIKQAGFIWGQYEGEYMWNITVPHSRVNEMVQRAVALGAEYVKDDLVTNLNYKIAFIKSAKRIKEYGIAPDVPQFLKGQKWNGKIYGKDKNKIYINGVETTLTDDELAEVKKYNSDKEKYLKAINGE